MYVFFEGKANGDIFQGKINFQEGVYEGDSIYFIKNGKGKLTLRENESNPLGGIFDFNVGQDTKKISYFEGTWSKGCPAYGVFEMKEKINE